MGVAKCEWCKMPERVPGTGKEVDHSDCKEKAKNPDDSLPDPECDHENRETTGGISGTQPVGGRPKEMSATCYKCNDCGGEWYE